MAKSHIRFSWLLPVLMLLSGCSAIGDKAGSISVIYAVTAIVSLMILAGYCAGAKPRDGWYLLLFSSVLVVNIGYFALSVSRNLSEALLANRLAYLGSVFLPLAMAMIIIRSTHIRSAKWLPGLLLGLAVVVFLIAASPGYLPIYYREVAFKRVDGVSALVKVYGPLHVIYLIYLLGYFAAMVATIIHATVKSRIDSPVHTVLLAVAVLINIGVWMIEQLVHIDFEILSVSYIISESFLLGLKLLMAESEKQKAHYAQLAQEDKPASEPEAIIPAEEDAPAEGDLERAELFLAGLSHLTPKEQALYDCYVAGMTTDVIMEKLNIKENTLKFHNKNLYGKLGVRSRKQLMELHRQCGGKKNT